MKNKGFEAWKARLEYMEKEFSFTKSGIVELKNEIGNGILRIGKAYESRSIVCPHFPLCKLIGNFSNGRKINPLLCA